MSDCYVSDADYRQHFAGRREQTATSSKAAQKLDGWSGIERRVGPIDRRSPLHDRRWQASSGRRFRLADRRRA
jgi:hypothetical protein